MTPEEVKEDIRKYIVETVEDESVNDSTALISGGILDSISTLKMVDFLETKFDIEFQPHDVDKENLDTIDMIAEFVLSKN